ncbi:MAG: 50S ribosomal protein L6 [Clostridia bacterium]|nr:50S ribosomal protein L6 [Clostridia bacterium]
MSRIGKMPIEIPAGVKIELDNGVLTVSAGAKVLTMNVHPEMALEIKEKQILVTRPSDSKNHKALHGLTRSLVANMVTGVSKGFEKALDINGVGCRAQKQGNKLVLNLGYSHPIEMDDPEGILIEVPAPNRIVVKGADKQLVGETAAKIRAFRLPDAYKGKGIKYDYEVLKLKPGKTGSK